MVPFARPSAVIHLRFEAGEDCPYRRRCVSEGDRLLA